MINISTLIAVDIGNSRIKLGRFDRFGFGKWSVGEQAIPEPTSTLDLTLVDDTGAFAADPLVEWFNQHIQGDSWWQIASVHRGAAERLLRAIVDHLASKEDHLRIINNVSHVEIPLTIRVDEPNRVGIDRLLAAVSAFKLRDRGRVVVIVDIGTAITVDLLDADGAFVGGAILPGISMSAKALAEQTDALPHIGVDILGPPPNPLGKSTELAIKSGVFWGAIGAIRELIRRFSTLSSADSPQVFVTGGTTSKVADLLAASTGWTVRHVPHMVLAGIALVDAGYRPKRPPSKAGT